MGNVSKCTLIVLLPLRASEDQLHYFCVTSSRWIKLVLCRTYWNPLGKIIQSMVYKHVVLLKNEELPKKFRGWLAADYLKHVRLKYSPFMDHLVYLGWFAWRKCLCMLMAAITKWREERRIIVYAWFLSWTLTYQIRKTPTEGGKRYRITCFRGYDPDRHGWNTYNGKLQLKSCVKMEGAY